jgi:hypothetical protein
MIRKIGQIENPEDLKIGTPSVFHTAVRMSSSEKERSTA